jgi:hypothetical protein
MLLLCDDAATAHAWVSALRALVVTIPRMLRHKSMISQEQLELLRHAFKASDDGQGFITLQVKLPFQATFATSRPATSAYLPPDAS